MYTTYRIFDENEYTREYGNRIFSGVIGYRWVVLRDGEIVDTDILRTFAEVKRLFPSVIRCNKP